MYWSVSLHLLHTHLTIHGDALNGVNQFTCLWSILSPDHNMSNKVHQTCLNCLRSLLPACDHLTITTKVTVNTAICILILLYGCESWDSTPTSQKDSWGFPRLLSAEYADGSVWLMAHLLRAVTCLGVTLDQELTFADHIRRLTGRCFHSLRQLRSIRRILTTDTIITLVNALSSVELTTVTLYSLACTTSICGSSNEFSTLQHD